MLSNSRLRTQAAWVVGSLGLGQAMTAVSFLLIARAAPPATYGHIMAAMGAALTIAAVIDFGANNLGIREMASSRLDPDAFLVKLRLRVGVAVAGGAVVLAAVVVFAPSYSVLGFGAVLVTI